MQKPFLYELVFAQQSSAWSTRKSKKYYIHIIIIIIIDICKWHTIICKKCFALFKMKPHCCVEFTVYCFKSLPPCTYNYSFSRQGWGCSGRHSGTEPQQEWLGRDGHSSHCSVSIHWFHPDGRSGTPGCPASAPADPEMETSVMETRSATPCRILVNYNN